MKANPGQLDQRITIEKRTTTSNEFGETIETWSTRATVWAQARPLTGTERERPESTQGRANYAFVIRYRDDVLTTDRIMWRGRAFNVRFISDSGPRAIYLSIDAEFEAQ